MILEKQLIENRKKRAKLVATKQTQNAEYVELLREAIQLGKMIYEQQKKDKTS